MKQIVCVPLWKDLVRVYCQWLDNNRNVGMIVYRFFRFCTLFLLLVVDLKSEETLPVK